ncbi:MAG: hypothetical protein DRO90_03165 [Candidatus Altiarchaeales archaeon]|nr:MAG: hypothetical protein DRO95_05290 [Candidatus Altiarchaeales archaeon]RLI93735.1 MAG: hypothetical protein DRO90_03165 [Candidatus Altiarchaeales archaeon]RLI94319.1 MAG: hypothetical protein DRO94_03170 [Candidatus Altiarchaeales archaeon]HDO81857.1 hypothetical protein [Candidatus Altiarchaeales archaeon]HEX54506.1 hypothetical protein [Candidatus Altiarchaeales archaeon]
MIRFIRLNIKVIYVIIIFFAVLMILFAFLILEKAPKPEGIIKKPTDMRADTPLFKVYIVRYPTTGNITELNLENRTLRVGISTDRDELNFGVIPQNLSVRKFLNLKNKRDSRARVCIRAYGTISDFIKIKDSDFVMERGESREIELVFTGDSVGNYSGEIDVITKKPKYQLLEFLLPIVGC